MSTDVSEHAKDVERDMYLLGMIDGGLQLARVRLNEIGAHDRYMFFDPENLNFTTDSPSPEGSDHEKVYLPAPFRRGASFTALTLAPSS